jgi:outer membrane receptor for ferrienterochelin and colicin
MNKNFSIKFLTTAMFCLLLGIAQVFAQAGNGGITGVVTDSNGAVIPNATVKLVSVDKGTELTTTASDDGIYTFTLLAPGRYTVSASGGSFAEQKLDVEVQVGRTTDANFTLGTSAVAAEVTVTAEGVQTTQSNSDAVLNETAIQNLPINGRRFQDFVTLTPSAQVEGSRGQISLSGQRGINGNVNVDGVDFNQPFFGGIRGGERSNQAFVIPQESIKEFQVVAAGYSAEFGRSTGGIVNAVTKTGTNNLRGSLFYLYRPEQLARGNSYTKALEEQRLTALGIDATLAPTQHQFGGSVGGPIIKDKLFYFASYEQQRFRAPRQVLIGSIAGFTFPTAPTVNRGQEALDFLHTLETSYEQTNDAYAVLGRIDWNLNNNNRFNGRFNYSRNDALNAAATGETVLDPTTNSALSANGIERNRNRIFVGQFISNLTASSINELRFQYARETRPREANELSPNVFFGANFGQYGSRNFLPTTQFDTRTQIADSLTYIAGNHTFKFGGEYSRIYANQEFGFNQFGAYSLTTGGTTAILRNISATRETTPALYLGRFDDTNARYARQIGNLQTNFVNQELSFYAQDSWRISPKFTVNYGLRMEQQYNPDPEATNTGLINVVQNTIFPIRGTSFNPAQVPNSGWQFGPRLGFAYDPEGNGKTVLRGFGGIYYARTPGLIFADTVNNFRATPGNVSTTLPFTGFSQAAFNTFLGTAAGQAYRTITGCDPTVTPLPAACVPNTVYRQFAIAGINLNSSPLASLPNVTPEQIAVIAGGLGLSANPFVGATVTGHAEDFKNPRSYQFGFGIERELLNNFIVGIDYSFVKTDRLQRNRDLNVPSPLTSEQYRAFLQANNSAAVYTALVNNGTINTILTAGRSYIALVTPGGVPTTVQIPNPNGSGTVSANVTTTRQRPTNDPALNPIAANRLALGSVQVRESTGKSLYQGLTFRMRLVRKWGQLNAYYTLSKNYSDDDNERDSGGVAYANPYDLRGEWGPSRLDRLHQFVANPVFFLPYGFEVSSAIRLRSGTPINTFIGTDANGDNVFNDRPILVPGVELSRNYFRNRNLYDIDMRVQKGFNFSERRRLIFTGEFFNVLNRPNIVFAFPGTNSTSGILAQYCATGSQLCGLSGITNVNFLQIREQNPASANFGKINLTANPGSQVFQVQLGARFQF